MKPKHNVLFITMVPTPYQRDLFGALAARGDIDLSVCYMAAASADSPWPEKPLRSFERILPGFSLPFGDERINVNWGLPNLSVPDVIVVSTFTSVTGQWLMRYGLRGKCWLFWGERLHRNTGLKGIIQRRLAAPMSRASAMVGIGSTAEADFESRFPHIPHFCVPYHCDLSSFLSIPRNGLIGLSITFLFCGQMIRRKGVDLLLLAFDRLIAGGLEARLLLVGREADLPNFLEMVSPAAQSRVHYEGFQPPERLAEYFAKSDVFVLPSRHDGWGVVVNQAIAAGLPIITSDAVGAGLDLVEDGINGLCVAAGNVDALHAAMQTLTNVELARQFGERSRRKAKQLTPEAGAEKWLQVFDCVRSRSRGGEGGNAFGVLVGRCI
jgi:glycosyltransferase involved in cell wall biosynthesis